VSPQGRAHRTTEKMKSGGLPAPRAHTGDVSRGEGQPCDGCGETIHPTEKRYSVTVQDPAIAWRFHEECYDAWASFNPT
jgi:hypothetical protein